MSKGKINEDLLRRITKVKVTGVSDEEIKYKLPSGGDDLLPPDIMLEGSMPPDVMVERALILTDTHGMLEYIDKNLGRFDLDNTKIKIKPEQIKNIAGLKIDNVSDKSIEYTLVDGTKGTLPPEVATERALLYTCVPQLMEKVSMVCGEKGYSTPGQMGE